MKRQTRRRQGAFAALAAGIVIVACSAGGVDSTPLAPDAAGAAGAAGSSGSSGGDGGKAGSSAGSSGNGAGTSGSGGGVLLDDGGMSDVLPEGCDGVNEQATRVPLTVYVMVDRSASMAGDKWTAARAGLEAFINDKGSDDISVGLTLFPVDNPTLEDCSFKNYQDPLVTFGKLPGNAKALDDQLDMAKPNGQGTPIYPALGGALDRGITFHGANPNDNFVVLLVTDGEPEGPPDTCGSVDPLSQDTITSLVGKANSMFGIRTFVVGLPGVNKAFAQAVAKSGGSDAILITNGTQADIQAQFQTALAKVRGDGLGCEYPLPADSTKYDKTEVNVRYTDSAGAAHDLSHSVGCASPEGWQYDNEQTPTKILLCSATCTQVKGDGLAKMQVVLGCPTREIK
jgi:Mg-chelatase subunit ChlD